jgi:hypothetical protein
MKLARIQGHSALQCLEKSQIFSNIVILSPDPLPDGDTAFLGTLNNDAYSRRPRISQRATVDIRNQIKHSLRSAFNKHA